MEFCLYLHVEMNDLLPEVKGEVVALSIIDKILKKNSVLLTIA